MNHLANEKSPYLRHAAAQKVDWRPWSDDAFETARREHKPVFLSTGAVWCHWCHVMAGECFQDQETAELMNELFICIKLDRDERPDIDRRYQQAVAAMGGGSGWPLSVFLTPDRRPFFGGTYFPPEDRLGKPGFKKVLRSASEFYRAKRGDAEAYAAQVMEALKPDPAEPGELKKQAVTDAVTSILAHYDPLHGGFGSAPKFPMSGALEFLIHGFPRMREGEFIESAIRKTLDSMAQGGFHDQLGGGFHRYSVDDAWTVPHFEKMTDDNAWLLRNYIDAYAVLGDERYKKVAEGIVRFTREVLSDPGGGFYASQDADVTFNDEGGYFTWTREEFKKALTDLEYQILSRHLLDARGSMDHDPSKHVLFIAQEAGMIASDLDMPMADVQRVMQSGKDKLLRARTTRKTPFIDKTLYTSLNGMMIASYFRAFRILRDPEITAFALASLERILKERLHNNVLFHAEAIPAVLDDYVHLIEALVAAYEVTAETGYLDQADGLMRSCMAKFEDPLGGFFDTEHEVLGTRLKRIEDMPHPSANALAIMLLLKLHLLTDHEPYHAAAGRALALFTASAAEIGIHAGTYFCGLDAWFTLVTLSVEAPKNSDLACAALALSVSYYTTLRYGDDLNRLILCRNKVCSAPISDPKNLTAVLRLLQGSA